MKPQFLGQYRPVHNIRCDKCGRLIGPAVDLKMAFRQTGVAEGNFCNRTHAMEAYDEMVKANPELAKE
jgi:hypothetical protein